VIYTVAEEVTTTNTASWRKDWKKRCLIVAGGHSQPSNIDEVEKEGLNDERGPPRRRIFGTWAAAT